ncbi:MAG: hypothetical protein NTZ56_19805 [Acidobacteria bacterium]|nr:hypothetical protein [Acidobacteriota bacterium]
MNRVTIGLVFGAVACMGQPVIESAENAAGFMKAGLPNSGLAQGSLVVIKGRNLSQRNLAQGGMPLPLELAGTSAQITVGSATLPMPINYVIGTTDDRTQISVVVPSATPAGLGSIRVTYQGKGSAAFPVTVVRTAFGIFTINSAGSGAAVVFTGATLNTPTESLAPGAVAQIFGTGLGPVPYSDRLPAEAGNLNTEVEVWVGFKKAKVHYQGRVPEIASIDQINFTVPLDTPPGCAVSLLVRAGGVVGNATTIPVAPTGGNCSDPLGLPTELFGRAAQGVHVGAVNLVKTATSTSGPGIAAISLKTDLLSGSFQRFDYSQLLSYPGNGPSVGSCNVYSFAGRTPVLDPRVPALGLDAGVTLLASGPAGSVTMERHTQQKGLYWRTIGGSSLSSGTDPLSQEFLTAGRFTVTGPGGNDLAGFSASLTWPTGFSWTNQPQLSGPVSRSNDLVIRWEGAPADGYVTISGYSIGGSAAAPVGASFSCLAPGAAGSFTVPALVLQLLPPAALPSETAPAGQLTVAASGAPVAFTTPGLDHGSLNYSSAHARTVTFQ